MNESLSRPNPKRVAAGRLNRQKNKDLTPAGREKLRQAALANRPWRYATGPKTPAGKARVALNGKLRQKGERSGRELESMLAGLGQLASTMAVLRRSLQGEQS